MTATVTQAPTNYGRYARNTIPVVKLTTDETITVEVSVHNANTSLFTGQYTPDFEGKVAVDLRGLFDSYLSTEFPDGDDLTVQTAAVKEFDIALKGDTTTSIATYDIYVCNAVIRGTTYSDFISTHFLTNQPYEKFTDMGAPEYLTWFDTSGSWYLKARFYLKAGGYEDVTIHTDTASGIYTLDVSLRNVLQHSTYLPKHLLAYHDIMAYSGKDELLMRQRYIHLERTGKEKYYLFQNMLGGIDTLICKGANTLQPETTHNTGRFGDNYVMLDDTDEARQWQQLTGTMPWRNREWLHEILTAKRGAERYVPEWGYVDIVITASDIAMGDASQLAEASFAYIMKDATNAMAQWERDTKLHASAAAQAAIEEEDITVTATLAFSAATGGGYETEAVTVYSDHIYVTIGGISAVNVVINGTLSDTIDPASRMPVVIDVDSGDEVVFSCQDETDDITVSFYPNDDYPDPLAQTQTETAQEQTES